MSFSKLLKELDFEPLAIQRYESLDKPLALVNQIENDGFLLEAIQCLAHVLPPRESVWWASQVLKAQLSDEKALTSAVLAAEKWAMEPTEDNRQIAAEQVDLIDMSSAEGLLCLAAKFATGTMAESADIHLPPPEKLYAKMSAGAVLVAMQKSLPDTDAFLVEALASGKKVLEKA